MQSRVIGETHPPRKKKAAMNKQLRVIAEI
jgi:hypothetical protein